MPMSAEFAGRGATTQQGLAGYTLRLDRMPGHDGAYEANRPKIARRLVAAGIRLTIAESAVQALDGHAHCYVRPSAEANVNEIQRDLRSLWISCEVWE